MNCLASQLHPLTGKVPLAGKSIDSDKRVIFRALQLSLSLFSSIDKYTNVKEKFQLGAAFDPDT